MHLSQPPPCADSDGSSRRSHSHAHERTSQRTTLRRSITRLVQRAKLHALNTWADHALKLAADRRRCLERGWAALAAGTSRIKQAKANARRFASHMRASNVSRAW